MTTRGKKLLSFGAPKDICTTGFRRALYELVREIVLSSDEHYSSIDEEVEMYFLESFGNLNVVPAAYQIIEDEDGWPTIHVFELEISAYISLDRIHAYSIAADTHEICFFCLHIFDRYGRERIIEQEQLETFWTYYENAAPDKREFRQQKRIIQEIVNGADPEALITKSERTRKYKAAYDALREMGIKI